MGSQSPFFCLKQKLIFIVGKGGVGRSSLCTAAAAHFSEKGEKVLVVQWSLVDSISQIFQMSAVSHKAKEVLHTSSLSHKKWSFFNMNFEVDEAIREYFVDHLKLKLIYSLVIQNKHVQKLLNAAPGISELFFLGRLFWLVELAEKECGFSYDRIIVDTPATGHGISLFGVAQAVAKIGITGPLALECARVSSLLTNPEKTAVLLVTLPEELPIEETMESIPTIHKKLGFKPTGVIVNMSVRENIFPCLSSQESLSASFFSDSPVKNQLKMVLSSLFKRNIFEKKLQEYLLSVNIPHYSIPDFNLLEKDINPKKVIEFMVDFFHRDYLA